MIREWFKYSIVSILAVLFIYAACGYNLAKYCCNTCEAEGIESLINEPCHKEAATCCSTKREENNKSECTDDCATNTCIFYHLKVDDSVLFSEEKRHSSNESYNTILFSSTFILNFSKTPNVVKSTLEPPDIPHPIAGRAMLNSNCILRI